MEKQFDFLSIKDGGKVLSKPAIVLGYPIIALCSASSIDLSASQRTEPWEKRCRQLRVFDLNGPGRRPRLFQVILCVRTIVGPVYTLAPLREGLPPFFVRLSLPSWGRFPVTSCPRR